jgi:hypothetical protein
MPINHDEHESKHQLVELVQEAIRRDNALREQYQIGEKFRFVRDRLQALLEQLEKHVRVIVEEEKSSELEADETLVYVYLYNSQGIMLQTWLNMLTPKLFYEYSVNRPIYHDKSYIDLLLRSKVNKTQHAFLTVAVKQNSLLRAEDASKDALGNPMVKIKEGALHFDKLVTFTHNGQEYTLSEERELIKKK